jgi:hypothetical protein
MVNHEIDWLQNSMKWRRNKFIYINKEEQQKLRDLQNYTKFGVQKIIYWARKYWNESETVAFRIKKKSKEEFIVNYLVIMVNDTEENRSII